MKIASTFNNFIVVFLITAEKYKKVYMSKVNKCDILQCIFKKNAAWLTLLESPAKTLSSIKMVTLVPPTPEIRGTK
ncbi:MAG TPA: hypothetical protein DDX92_13150 [Flavobacteriales bacterium]|nr:hypothetical protein [Flavobacteriales bacterium]